MWTSSLIVLETYRKASCRVHQRKWVRAGRRPGVIGRVVKSKRTFLFNYQNESSVYAPH
jgi:hypothetical protein